MLMNLNELFSLIKETNSAVGAFNVYNLETIRGVFEGAQEADCPVILAFGEKYLENMSPDLVYSAVNHYAQKTGVPSTLHLDHCKDTSVLYNAIRSGFTSVMYDGSTLPFEENIANTAEVVRFAHACGVSVEAELGSLAAGTASHEGSASDIEMYTNPEEAEEFVRKTGVDALAVSIGTVHGRYKGTPNIRVDILKAIHDRVDVPLVLHGGSGTPEDIVKECIRNGIRKINVNTEISRSAVDGIRKLLNDDPDVHLADISLNEIESVRDAVDSYASLFYRV